MMEQISSGISIKILVNYMADFTYYLTYNGRTPVLNERTPIYEYVDPTNEYLISQTTIPGPTMSGSPGTYSRDNNDWWEAGFTTTDTTTWPYSGSDYQNIDVFSGTGSSIVISDNFLGSRWGMTGGSGIYSAEFPAFTISLGSAADEPFGIYQQLSFEPLSETANPTYCQILSDYFLDVGGAPGLSSSSINFIENGIAQKQVVVGTTNKRFKVIFDRNTNETYVYSTPNTSGDYTTLVATYSWDSQYVTKAPFAFTGWIPTTGSFPSYGIIDAFGPMVMSNYQVNGLTGTNISGTAGTPDASQRYDLGLYNV
jgi:hypothetical protein